MRYRTRAITTCAMLSALSAASLWLASVLPTGQVGFAALASLFGIAAVVETGIKGGAAVYVCSLILGLLLSANKAPAILYGLFLGYYPILKCLAERRKSRVFEWIIKLAVMNAALAAIILLFRTLVFDMQTLTDSYAVIFGAANAVYIVFDIGVSKAIGFYINAISKRRRGRN